MRAYKGFNTGYKSVATNTDNKSVAINTGDKSVATNTGYMSVATNTGDMSVATVSGADSIAIATGINGKVKGAIGCAIVCVERGDYDEKSCPILAVKADIVDGTKIKPDTWYTVRDGEWVEAEESEED